MAHNRVWWLRHLCHMASTNASNGQNMWVRWLHNRFRLVGPQHFTQRFKLGDKFTGCPLEGGMAKGSSTLQSGGEIRGRPQLGRVAASPLQSIGDPMIESRGRNQRVPTTWPGGYITPTSWGVPNASKRGKNRKWPTCGPGGYITHAAYGVPNASVWGTK